MDIYKIIAEVKVIKHIVIIAKVLILIKNKKIIVHLVFKTKVTIHFRIIPLCLNQLAI